ncbi:MAG: GMC family oxidoreductase [Ilumatobacteraceae bacterium]
MVDIVVVGAGSAGAVIAGRAVTRFGRSVTLVEAGPVHDAAAVPAPIAGPNFHRALEVPGRTWGATYSSGRGVGGSSSVNAMVGLVEGLDDLTVVDGLPIELRRAMPRERGVLSEAFAAAARSLAVPVGDALLTRSADGRRCSVNEAYLEPARQTGRLDVLGDAVVDRVLFEGTRAVGVRLADGREVSAGRVVIAAGAVRTPAVLLRSGVDRPSVGVGLQDHPALTIPVRLRADAVQARDGVLGRRPGEVVSVTSVGRLDHPDVGGLQLLAADSIDGDDPTRATLMAVVLQVESRGRVSLASTDPLVEPLLEFDPGAHPTDRMALVMAHRALEALLATPELAAVVAEAGDAALGGAHHASSTCRMGRPDDVAAVVDHECRVLGTESLWVCDASVFPRAPRTNPHLPVVLLAERIAAVVGT